MGGLLVLGAFVVGCALGALAVFLWALSEFESMYDLGKRVRRREEP